MSENTPYKPTLCALLAETLRGKAVGRTFTNLFWRGRIRLSGSILDIGGGGRGSHYRFLEIESGATIRVADIVPRKGTDFVLDITKTPVPLPDGSQDAVLMFNILEHLASHTHALGEARRLLRAGGLLIGTVPFLVNVHPDPHDYLRLTKEALLRLFNESGFSVRVIEPIGRGPFLAAYEQLDMLLSPPIHCIFLPLVWCLDGLIQALRPRRDLRAQFPLAYNFIVEKVV